MSGVSVEVAQGDSAESLAYQHGHFLDTVWLHPNNAALRKLRQNPHILFPGDALFIPAIEPKQAPASTDHRHRFKRRGVPSSLSFQLRAVFGEVIANAPYRLELADQVLTGTTGADGTVTTPLMPDMQSATLTVQWQGQPLKIELGMRQLDPIDRMEGVQKRLQNLGFYTGEINGQFSPQTIAAVQQFQRVAGIATSGSLDATTLDALLQRHGC